MLFLISILIILLIIYYLVIKPIIPLIKLKIQFGEYATLDYFPLIGDIYKFDKGQKKFNDPFYYYRSSSQNSRVYKKFRLSNLLDSPVVGISDPEYYKYVLLDHQNYEKLDVVGHNQLLKKGLLYTRGQKWKKQRNSFGNSFHHQMLKSRIPMINQVVDYQLTQDKEKNNLLNLMSKITGNVVVNSFFSKDIEGIELQGKPISAEIVDIFNEIGKLQKTNPLIFLKQLIFKQKAWSLFPTKKEKDVENRINQLKLVCEKIIKNRIESYQKKEQNDDFLHFQIQNYFLSQEDNEEQVTIDEIIQQFITLAFSGTDTTATLSSIALIYMAMYPKDQNEIYEEIIQIRNEGDFTDEDLKQMVKLSAFINEVLRVRNPAICPFVRRALVDHQIKDLKIKKGWWVNVESYNPQASDRYYESSQEFNYKRWLNKDPIQNDNQFVFIPFSAGGRNCIGQHMAQIEAKIILAKVIRQFQPILTPNTSLYWTNLFLYSFGPENAVTLIPRK